MRILLVWCIIPEYTAIYSLEVDEETFARWSKVHGVFGNITNNYEQGGIIEEIGLEINQSEPIFSDKDGGPESAMPPILLQDHSVLIVTGFAL